MGTYLITVALLFVIIGVVAIAYGLYDLACIMRDIQDKRDK